ncbi:MAG: SGNH/GDSL hydrolase family protein [Notoacmeibacter sp.]|nr:SGNH/GDSL hydrolase family protein [Notoacmeibacter sp.]MCC0032766.1 SGNH/GDSL hydrolase family protein [Brucellaceae bacterium]
MATYLALPVYVWQGLAVRRKTPRLPTPPGPVTGDIAGEGKPFRLLVIGDSSAAGVGVDDTRDGLAVQMAEGLHERTGRPVIWRAAGSNSATSALVRDHVVPHLEPRDWTHVAISLGTNDMKNFHSVSRFKREFGTLLYALRARFPQAAIVWAPMIDMRCVPAMPKALAQILDIRGDAISAKGIQLCHERSARVLEPLSNVQPEGFCHDGFHASKAGYRAWGRHLADQIAALDEGVSRPA